MSTGLIATYPAGLFYECAFNAPPNQSTIPPWYTDLSARTKTAAQSFQRGRQYEFDINQAGVWNATLENKDGALDPTNTASPYAPGVVPYRHARVRAVPGVNALSVDQATAGEGSGYPAGPVPSGMSVSNDFGYPLTLAASGTAYQGNQVYSTVVPSAATQFSTILLVTSVPVVPGTAYAFSAQVRITAGTSTPTSAAILWLDRSGNTLSATAGASVTPTAGSNTWNAISVTGTAPNTALSATLKIQIGSGGSTSAQTTWQCDGLQWETSPLSTPWQQPQTLPANLLPRAVATGTASINTATDSPGNWFYATIGTLAQATGLSPAAATGSTTAVAWTTSAGATTTATLYAGAAASGTAATGPVADCVQVTAGLPYTASVYLMRTASADALTMQPAIAWYDQYGNALTPSTGTPALVFADHWIRVTATGTAPAGALWGRPILSISSPSPTTATNTLYCTGWQLEQAGGAGTWYDPGNTCEIFSGLIERWPQTWLLNGTYGVVPAIAVDSLAALAQYTLQAPFIEETLALGPDFLYTLGDPATASSCADAASRRIPAPVANSSYGLGSLTFGNSITATGAPGLFLGSSGPVVTFANPNTGANSAQTYIDLSATSATPGPPGVGAAWTRFLAFRASAIPAHQSLLWYTAPPSYAAPANQGFAQVALLSGTGQAQITITAPDGAHTVATASSGSVCDGNWHFVTFGISTDGLTVRMSVDGVAASAPFAVDAHPIGCASDALGCLAQTGANAFTSGFTGDMALAGQIPALLTNAQITNLYNSFRSASAGESSGQRAQRILAWVGWGGATAIDTGQTASMGPASDLAGATALDALNAVALTENGNFFASNNGALTFTSRTRRYGQQTPAYTFGENLSLGEWPYEDISADYDPAHLFNWIQVTQYSTSQVATAQDAASEQANFPRLLQRTINPSAYTEAQDAANYLLQQYKSARLRIANLTLNPGAIPGLFAACLAMDIGTRIRVMRRPPSAPSVQFDGFIEQMSWSIDPGSGAAKVQLQCSPADLSSYWQLAALRTTLHAQAASGQNTASINALPDAHVNQLSQSLPSGYQLVFDPGTPLQETMTIASGGIPSTTIGYQNATLTFTSNFANTHAAGAVVCEPLPAGVTDPTAYDSASVLGAASCQLAAAAGASATTITVGPLGDGQANPLGSDWTTGDLLSISPGTPNWEGYNLLRPNQSTAGEGVFPLATGTNGTTVGISSALGSALVTASGTAFQGSQVWQVAIGANASLSRAIRVPLAAAAAGLAHTWSVCVRSVTSGANPQLNAQIIFFDINGSTLSTTNGSAATLTGGASASWTRISVTATAPAGAVWAALGVPLSGTTPSISWSFQADGLQWEQSASASPYCTTPQILSVAASVPGYSTVTVTLNTPLINSHSQGDTVCDPLPPGVTSPASVAATCRLAY